MLELSSEAMRLHVMVSGSGLGPSCTITPDDMFNVIQTTHKQAKKALIFRVIIVGLCVSISLSLWSIYSENPNQTEIVRTLYTDLGCL